MTSFQPHEVAPTLDAHFGDKHGFDNQHVDGGCGLFVPFDDVCGTLTAKWAKGSSGPAGDECGNLVPFNNLIRKLTPLEGERLMGFPDGYTAGPHKGKPRSIGPRFKLLGNSIPVNCMSWIGHRIHLVDGIIR